MKVFFWINGIRCLSSSCPDEEDDIIEEHGFWRDIPCIMPIGTTVYLKSPWCSSIRGKTYWGDDFVLTIDEYDIFRNGDIICRVDDLCDGDEYGSVKIRGTRDEILRAMKKVGVVYYYEGQIGKERENKKYWCC